MPARNKQAERNLSRKDSKRQQEDNEPVSAGDDTPLVDVVKAWLLNACIVQSGPSILDIMNMLKDGKLEELKNASNAGNSATKCEFSGHVSEAIQYFEDHPDEQRKVRVFSESENTWYENSLEKTTEFLPLEADTNGTKNGNHEKQGPGKLFESFQSRLTWHNSLGLFEKDEDSKRAWLAVKGQELDFGPRAKRRGNPGLDRIKLNLRTNMAVYIYSLLALMTLRSLFFRSWFACLPWLAFYQFVSLALPLENMEKLPQLPLDKVPVFARVLVTTFCHTFLILFFLYELVWKTWFFEKIPLVGLVVYHAYAVRPVGNE